MKRRYLVLVLNTLWIGSVVLGGIKVALIDKTQMGTTMRGALFAGLGCAVALAILVVSSRKTLFPGKPLTEMTAKETALVGVCFFLAMGCVGALVVVSGLTMR